MKPLKTAVIGTGQLGQHHVRIYSELKEAELIAICDNNKKRKELADKYFTGFYTDYTSIPIHDLDAVSIATPTNTHYKIAKYFLKNGVNVLIEKPITNSIEEADELIHLAEKANLILRVGHIERYNAAFRAAKKLTGKIKFIEAHRLGPFTPRISDCGVVLDLMIHDLDIILSLIREEITYIDGVGINVLSKHEDIANVRIKFKNGATVNLTASRLTPNKKRKIRIFQDDACISINYQSQEGTIYKKELFRISEKKIDIEKEEPLKTELKDFIISVIKQPRNNRIDKDARNALAVALKILKSIEENNKIILGK